MRILYHKKYYDFAILFFYYKIVAEVHHIIVRGGERLYYFFDFLQKGGSNRVIKVAYKFGFYLRGDYGARKMFYMRSIYQRC